MDRQIMVNAHGDSYSMAIVYDIVTMIYFWVSKPCCLSGMCLCGVLQVENWFFAESTQTALLTFQACNDLPETGKPSSWPD
jgi:hypothetical protein